MQRFNTVNYILEFFSNFPYIFPSLKYSINSYPYTTISLHVTQLKSDYFQKYFRFRLVSGFSQVTNEVVLVS